jgi:hypothetical protein
MRPESSTDALERSLARTGDLAASTRTSQRNSRVIESDYTDERRRSRAGTSVSGVDSCEVTRRVESALICAAASSVRL